MASISIRIALIVSRIRQKSPLFTTKINYSLSLICIDLLIFEWLWCDFIILNSFYKCLYCKELKAIQKLNFHLRREEKKNNDRNETRWYILIYEIMKEANDTETDTVRDTVTGRCTLNVLLQTNYDVVRCYSCHTVCKNNMGNKLHRLQLPRQKMCSCLGV